MSTKRAADGPPVLNNMDAKHSSLVQDYLQLQDEFAALNDRLQAAKMRYATVLTEVRFLKRRLKQLKEFTSDPKAKGSTSTILHCDSSMTHTEKSNFEAVAPDRSSLSPKNKLLGTTENHMFWEPHKKIGSDEFIKWKGFNDNAELVSALNKTEFRNSPSPNVFTTVMAGKRKISWEDHISLECN